MASAAAVLPVAPQSPVADLRNALDRLGHISAALNSVRDLLIPEEGLGNVDRGNLALLFGVLDDAARECNEDEADAKDMAASAMRAVSDLLNPSKDLRDVSRDNLCSLVELLGQMHAGAVAQAWQSMQRLGE